MKYASVVPIFAAMSALFAMLAGCGSEASSPSGETTTVSSCGITTKVPHGSHKLYIDAWRGLIDMTLAVRAADRVVGWGNYDDNSELLQTVFGSRVVDSLPKMRKGDATVENVVASGANIFVTNADEVADKATDAGLAVYRSADTCPSNENRSKKSDWETLFSDMINIGRISGHTKDAKTSVSKLRARLDALNRAPQPDRRPTVLLVDNVDKKVYSSGGVGPVDRIIEASGGRNALHSIPKSWTEVSWEKVVASAPDFIAFSDYEGQTVSQKIKALKSNRATKDLPAVQQDRFLSLPVNAWVSSPLNVGAAEHLRVSLERFNLVPSSNVKPAADFGSAP